MSMPAKTRSGWNFTIPSRIPMKKNGPRGTGWNRFNSPGGEKIYCGLVLVSGDQEDVIEWLDPSQEKTLEYNVTRIIQDLQSVKKKVVGVISDLPVFGNPAEQMTPGQKSEGPWFFIEELKKAYDVRNIPASSTEIDPDVKLLMIIYPKTLSEALRYAVDQYVLSGGNVLVFADPLCVSDRSQGPQQFMGSAGASLPKLFASWGVSMDPKMAIADFDQAHPRHDRKQHPGGKSPHDFRKGPLLQPGGYRHFRSGEYAFPYRRGDNAGGRQSVPV